MSKFIVFSSDCHILNATQLISPPISQKRMSFVAVDENRTVTPDSDRQINAEPN
jgi:hypothetical protein